MGLSGANHLILGASFLGVYLQKFVRSNEKFCPCSDSFPLFGYRRRSYLVLSGLLGALSWTLMSTFVDSKYGAAFCILLGSLSVAFSDVVSAFL